jgi:predicted dehydrogenase
MSSIGNAKARQLFEEGAIGQLVYAEGFWARNSPWGAWQYEIPNDASPETVDWDTFVSNTTGRKWDPLRFFRWRNYKDYGTGVTGDLFVHLFSSLHFVTGSLGPNKIQATGGLRFWKDGREVPDVMLGMFDYPETEQHPAFNLSLRVNFVDGTGDETYLRLVGSQGAMEIGWREVKLTTYETYDPKAALPGHESTMKGVKPMESEQMFRAEADYLGAHYHHFSNFFEGVRDGKQVTEDAIYGFRAAAPALLCNDSYYRKEIIEWDPVKMKLV